MIHPLYKVTDFNIVAPHRLHVSFDDGTTQDIDFRPILTGELFGPLENVELFNQVQLDAEVHTLGLAEWSRLGPRYPPRLARIASQTKGDGE